MAGNRFRAVQTAITTGTAVKTLMQIVAATNHKVRLDEISISFNGVSNTAEPIRVRILRQTTAGTMTALTLVKDPDDWSETIQTTAQHTATAEPTASDVLMAEYVHPQQGYTWQAPTGREIYIGGGDRIGIEVLAVASVSANVRVAGEE
jgi:hypothetical protein